MHFVEFQSIFTGLILFDSGDEGLRELEAWDPEDIGRAVSLPVLQEFDSFVQINHPIAQRFGT